MSALNSAALYLELGKIVSVQGIKGEVRVEPWSDTPDFLLQFKTIYMQSTIMDGEKTPIKVEKSRVQKNVVILKLEGFNSIEEANTLRGRIIYMDKSSVKLPKGSYFIQDLIGMRVIDAADHSIEYGILTEVSPTGANDVYHIKNGNRVTLIPAIPQVIEKTDVENKIMEITPLKGLFDDED